MSVSASKSSLVHELFVRTADENYITARWCALNLLQTDFLWLAVHALEKYLKAVLLLNGKSAKTYSHDIVGHYAAATIIAGSLLPGALQKPADLDIFHWRELTPEDFVKHLFRNGNADNRYLIYGYITHSQDLHMLDQMVFAICRLICALDEPFVPGHQPGVPTVTNREVLANHPEYYHRLAMPLDDLVNAREDSDRRTAALNLNLAFAPDAFQHTSAPGGSSSRNPIIAQRILDPLESNDRQWAKEGIEIARWFLANVRVPKGTATDPGVKEEILTAIDAARAKFDF